VRRSRVLIIATLPRSHLIAGPRDEDRRDRDVLRGRSRIRMLLTKGQIGSVMGRRGSTIK